MISMKLAWYLEVIIMFLCGLFSLILSQARIDDLQKYVEVLKAEKEHLQLGNSARSWTSSLSSQMGNVRRVSVG